MAQAARLNLRMQKEIKLLLTDPPPGATFPFLYPQSDSPSSSSSSGSSLTSIDAQIEGPEGSVYEKGIFKLKIQIPERYPFQPPIVMFSTPIYHPNIDNGGRICLDILNLPPKGAWQPSLNISTVMTSIGLLISEPNPDDGLMQEASREYKYNRQVFDHKARSMTEKYARAGSVEMARETPSELNKIPVINLESMKPIKPVCEDFFNLERMHGVSKKLSLVASESVNQKKADREEVNHDFEFPTTKNIKGLIKESNLTITELNQTDNKLQCTKKKLRLGSKPVENGDSLTAGKPEHCEPEANVEKSTKCFSLKKNEFGSQQNLRGSGTHHLSTSTSIMDDVQSIQISPKDDKKQCSASEQSLPPPPPDTAGLRADEEGRNRFTGIRNKKLGLTGRRLPLEKLGSNQTSLKRNDKEPETKKSDEKLVGSSTENQEQASTALDSVVVLDSEEESEEEEEKAVHARSKLSLARRRLPVKRKS